MLPGAKGTGTHLHVHLRVHVQGCSLDAAWMHRVAAWEVQAIAARGTHLHLACACAWGRNMLRVHVQVACAGLQGCSLDT